MKTFQLSVVIQLCIKNHCNCSCNFRNSELLSVSKMSVCLFIYSWVSYSVKVECWRDLSVCIQWRNKNDTVTSLHIYFIFCFSFSKFLDPALLVCLSVLVSIVYRLYTAVTMLWRLSEVFFCVTPIPVTLLTSHFHTFIQAFQPPLLFPKLTLIFSF